MESTFFLNMQAKETITLTDSYAKKNPIELRYHLHLVSREYWKKKNSKETFMQERLICFALFFWCWCRCYKCLNVNFFLRSRKNNHLPAKNKLQSAVKIIMIMIIWIGCIHTYSCQDRHRAKIREVFSSPYKKISTQICTIKKQGIGLCSDRPRSFFLER